MAEFTLNDEQKMVQGTMRDFAREELRKISRDCDEASSLPEEVLEKVWSLGICATPIPEEYGGFGLERSALTSAIVAEEFAAGDLGMAVAALAPQLMMLPLLEFGTDEQKSRWLPMFCGEGYFPATAALMEPRVAFDPFELRTSAEKRGDTVVLDGKKCMVPLADRAQAMLVYAVCGGAVEAYIVDPATPGITIGERERNVGLRSLPLFPVTFSGCEIPAANRLGGEEGIDFPRLLNLSRATLSAMAVGVARASLEYAVDYAKERTAFGVPIASRQSIAFMLAESAMEVDAMRLLAWRAAWRLDRGEDATRDATLAKMYSAEQCMKITDYGVQILGGHGYIREHPVEMWFRNGRCFAAAEGIALG